MLAAISAIIMFCFIIIYLDFIFYILIGIYRYLYFIISQFLPSHGNLLAIAELGTSLSPGQVAHRMRSDDDSALLYPDAYNIRQEMVVDLRHHEMVHRSTHLRIPLFGKRGHSLLDLESVARHIIMRQHLVPEIGISVFQQCLKKVAVAHITGCQAVVMRMNIIYQMLEDLLAILGRNHAQHQRNGIGCLTSRIVIYLFYCILYDSIRRRFLRRCSLLNMQEFLLESLQDFRSQDGIAVGFAVFPLIAAAFCVSFTH